MARDYICLQCRTALDEPPCDGRPRHRVESMRTKEGREALRRTVWGPVSLRRQAKRAAVAGGVAGGATWADGCVGCAEVAGGGPEGIAIVLAIAIAVGAFWLLYRLAVAIRRYAKRPVANGAEAPVRLGPAVAEGTVRAADTFASPLSSEPCVAYGLELSTTRWFRRRPTYRDGATCGFALELDDGRTVEVPAGRCAVALRDPATSTAYSTPARRLLGDLAAETSAYPLVPFDTASQQLVRDGDRVALHTATTEVLDPSAPHVGGYRDAPPTRLTVAGAPRLRLITPRE